MEIRFLQFATLCTKSDTLSNNAIVQCKSDKSRQVSS